MAEENPRLPEPHESVDAGQDAKGDQHSPQKGYETSDVNVRGLLIFAAGFVVALAVVAVVLSGMFWTLLARENAAKESDLPLLIQERERRAAQGPSLPDAPAKSITGEPLLEGINPSVPLRSGVPGWPSNAEELLRRDHEVLGTYGWVDRDKGIVRVPIDRAIELMAVPGKGEK